jgi:hypothetical protein
MDQCEIAGKEKTGLSESKARNSRSVIQQHDHHNTKDGYSFHLHRCIFQLLVSCLFVPIPAAALLPFDSIFRQVPTSTRFSPRLES